LALLRNHHREAVPKRRAKRGSVAVAIHNAVNNNYELRNKAFNFLITLPNKVISFFSPTT